MTETAVKEFDTVNIGSTSIQSKDDRIYEPANLLSYRNEERVEEATPLQKEQERLNAAMEQASALIEEGKGAVSTLQSAVQNVVAEWDQFKQNAAAELSRLALLIAEHVIDAEIKTSPELVLKICRSALETVYGQGHCTLFINSADLLYLQNNLSDEMKALCHNGEVAIEADDSVARASCRIELNTHYIEAGVVKSLEYLWNELGGMPEDNKEPANASSSDLSVAAEHEAPSEDE